MKAKMWIILVIIILLLIVLVQNTGIVTLRLLFWGVAIPQFLLLVFALIIGFIIGYLTCLLSKKK